MYFCNTFFCRFRSGRARLSPTQDQISFAEMLSMTLKWLQDLALK